MTRSLCSFTTAAPLLAALFTASSLGALASAQTLPINYQLQLQVRADTGGTAFNLPNSSTFNSVTASLNDAGKVAVKVSTVGATTSPGLWFGGQGTGALVYNANDNAALLSDPFLNNNNQASFPRFASSNTNDDGLYVYSHTTGLTPRVTNGPLGATSYTNPQINDNGIIGMRAKFSIPQALVSYHISSNIFTNYVTETSGDPNSRYSFIYAPAFNNNNRIAAEANIDGQAATFKELRVWNSDGSSILVASGDSSAGPMFFAFDNGISMNNHDQVAFTTRTSTSATTRRIVVSDGTSTTLFPTVSAGAGFTSIDSFAPSINDSGLVAFRGNDNQAAPKDSVFVTDGTIFQRIAGVGDTLLTDAGPRVVGFLMGGVHLNNRGSVSFGVQFTGASGGGHAVYVAYVRVMPLSVVSRKTHGATGSFDVNLPLTGTTGIESRRGGGPNSDSHQVIVTFAAPATFTSAAVVSGTGIVDSTSTSGNQVTINLAGVANGQTIALTLVNVNDGTNTSDVTIPLSLLVGDTNADRVVNSGDALQTRNRAGQAADSTNFRSDLNTDGAVNSGDTTAVRARAGDLLP